MFVLESKCTDSLPDKKILIEIRVVHLVIDFFFYPLVIPGEDDPDCHPEEDDAEDDLIKGGKTFDVLQEENNCAED